MRVSCKKRKESSLSRTSGNCPVLSVLAFLSRAEAMAPRFFSSSLLLAMFDTLLSLQLYLSAITLCRVFGAAAPQLQASAPESGARGTCFLLSWRHQTLPSQMPRFRVCACRCSLGGLLGSNARGANALHLGVALLVHITAVAMEPATTPSTACMAVMFFWRAVLPQA